jgi:hypothetical protein
VVVVRLGGDDRGRVPFALVGVALLLASAAFAGGVATQSRGPTVDDDVRTAVTATESQARSALRAAVEQATRTAARRPLVTTASTPFGQAIRGDNRSATFRNYLTARVLVAARAALNDASTVVGGVNATAGPPTADDPAALAAALRQVDLRRNGSRVRVAMPVTVVARRDGGVVARETTTVRATVRSPLFALRNRTAGFERRLNRSPAAGFGGRLTARLYAIAWARGYAQYGGAPIANVVSNRHVELAANGALVGSQRAAFGRTDPDSRAAVGFAATRVGVENLLAGVGNGGDQWVQDVLDGGPASAEVVRPPRPEIDRRRLVVGVNGSADRALLDLLEESSVDAALRRAYGVRARLLTDTSLLGHSTSRNGTPPTGERWVHADTERAVTTRVTANQSTERDGALARFVRVVTVENRTVQRWRRGEQTREVTTVRRTRHRVRAAVVAERLPLRHAPERGVVSGIAPAVRERALAALVGDRGGRDAVARQTARGRLGDTTTVVRRDPPERVVEAVYADVVGLAGRVQNSSVSVAARQVVDGAPTERLREMVEERRASLLDAPETYPTPAVRGRVAARGAYLAAVRARLRDRTATAGAARSGLLDQLSGAGVPVGDLAELSTPPPMPDRSSVATSVEMTPAYLTTARVTPQTAPVEAPYRPLAARNHELFDVPYDGAADALAEAVLPTPPETVRLRTAGQVLAAADRRPDAESSVVGRDRLRKRVAAAVGSLRETVRVSVAETGLLDAETRRAAMTAATRRWATPDRQALAAANGSLARAFVAEATTRANLTAEERARLTARTRTAVRQALGSSGVRPAAEPVAAVGGRLRDAGRAAVSEAAKRGLDAAAGGLVRRFAGSLLAVPEGVPLLPVPGYWYATANAWHVSVSGRYERVAVRAPADSPAPSPNVTYVREAAPVGLDVDGDGAAERLGRNRPVRFAVETGVVVVVPPGGPGVGDRGPAVEASGN